MGIARDVEDMLEAAFGEGVAIVLRVLSIFAVVLWLNHVIACGWYAVGVAGSDTGGSWPQSTVDIRGSPVEYEALGAPFLYASAFHWSMAQMTLGATEVPASNTFERLANITMLLVGLLISSTLVSSLSAGLINSQLRAAEKNERLLSLRKYLRQRGVSPQLSIRVRQQAVHRMQETQLLEESDVPAMTVLSASLRAQLRFDMFVPNLSRYPLFRLWTTLSADTLQNFCYSCVSFSFLPAHDDLFVAGAEAEAMYFILSGTVLYTQDPSTSMVSALQHDVVEHRYLCEACLWTEWTHVGTAGAMSRCEIIHVSPAGLMESIRTDETVAKVFRTYGAIFHARVVGSKVLPTDMRVHDAGFEEVVMAMGKELRVVMGLESLKYVQTHSVFQMIPQHFLSGLSKQVEDGRCTIIVSESGEPVRVTAVAVLRIEDALGRILVQIGTADGDVRAQIELPGSKFLDAELPEEAAARILETKLKPLHGRVQHVRTQDRTEKVYPSKSFNLLTKYLRTEIQFRFEGQIEAPVVCAEWETTLSKESHRRHKNQRDFSDLMSREVYLIKCESKTFMYTWLDMAEYQEMSKQTHAEFLQTWCLALDIGRDVNTTRTSRLQFPLGPTRSSRNFESLPKA